MSGFDPTEAPDPRQVPGPNIRGPQDMVAVPRLAFVGLGSNVGDRLDHLRAAVHGLSRLPATTIVACSSIFVTAPMGPAQHEFLNAVVALDTVAAPRPLLDVLLQLERSRGRVRDEPWGPRTLDLDLLAMLEDGTHLEVADPSLTLPHPGIAGRDFVLAPLLEIAPWLTVGARRLDHMMATLPGPDRTVHGRHREALLDGAPFGVRVPASSGG